MEILIGILIIIFSVTVFLQFRFIKKKIIIFSLTALLTFLFSTIIYVLLHFSCLDGCYIKKYTLKWFVIMYRSTIVKLPVINSINDVEYYYNGELGESWQVSYKSNSKLNEIEKEIKIYLTEKKVEFNSPLLCDNGYWDFNNQTVIIRCEFNNKCMAIYLDDYKKYVLIRALEMK